MGCVAALVNLSVCEGGTFDKAFQWKTGTPAVVVDLTGYTAKMDIRTTIANRATVLELLSIDSAWTADGATGIYFTDRVNGEYKIYINDADTVGICPTHADIAGVYDLFLYSAAEEAVLKQYGSCTLVAAVTR